MQLSKIQGVFAIIYQANVDQQKSESKTYIVLPATDLNARCDVHKKSFNKTVVESVQLGNTYIADMDECPQDKYVVSAMWLAQCG